MTINYQPSHTILGANDLAVYVVYDGTNVSDPKFRYICQVFDGLTELAKLKQLPNSADAGVFDIHRIVSDYVQQDEGIHGSAMFTGFTKAYKEITIKFGYESAATATDEPVEVLNVISTTDIFVNAQFEQVYSPYDGGINDTFIPDGATSKFASILPTEIYAQVKDYGTVTLVNAGYTGLRYVYIQYFSGNTALNSHHFTVPATSTAANKLQYIGIYPANLQDQTINTSMRPSANAGWTHYTVVLKSGTLPSSPKMSRTYTVFLDEECKYEYTRLAFWNSLGGWDYINFRNATKPKVKVSKQDYDTIGGNWFQAGPGVPYARSANDGGTRTVNTEMESSYSISSGFYEQSYNAVFKDLLLSQRILRYELGNWIPTVMNTKDLEIQTQLNDKLIQYDLEIRDGKRTFQLR
jgi:hypothetical protein